MKPNSLVARFSILAVAAIGCFTPATSLAEDGHPIAIRRCSENGVSIETMWGLSVAFGVEKDSEQAKQFDLLAESIEQGKQVVLRRAANTDEVKTVEQSKQDNDIAVLHGAPWSLVFVDGVQILVMKDMPTAENQEIQKELVKMLGDNHSTAIVAIGEKFNDTACQKLIKTFSPRLIVVNPDIENVGQLKVKQIAHDTVAFSTSTSKTPQAVSLAAQPYELSEDLSKLFDRKEKSQQAMMDLFAKLSIKQMNFVPANGTHTPRWNTEHMMGRELLFFSQIYHALDPSIPVMDLNPKQMPKDYKFAHADWTGKEEAKQTQRVEDFTRRFAYLLEGVDIRKKAPGSRFWSVRALLLQMERHYNEHSSNVRKKMKLREWPAASQDIE